MNHEPILTTATLINNVVSDMLCQHRFNYAHFPELVDLAVIGTGLGMLQNKIAFVKNAGSFWDSTQWEIAPRPFLDRKSLAYANAIASWIRGDNDPVWAHELPSDVKRPMRKSLKFLFKTNDSFFHPETAGLALPNRSQHDWWTMMSSESVSTQVVALRHLESQHADQAQLELLAGKLRTHNRAVSLHAIDAVQQMQITTEPVAAELRLFVEDRDDEIRAKAMVALTRLQKLDESAIDIAVKMLDSNTRFVVFAGVLALASLDSTPDRALPTFDRAFIRALQTCDYEFVGLFAATYQKWLDDPKDHIENLLREDSPEYLQIALEALQNAREQLVALG